MSRKDISTKFVELFLNDIYFLNVCANGTEVPRAAAIIPNQNSETLYQTEVLQFWKTCTLYSLICWCFVCEMPPATDIMKSSVFQQRNIHTLGEEMAHLATIKTAITRISSAPPCETHEFSVIINQPIPFSGHQFCQMLF